MKCNCLVNFLCWTEMLNVIATVEYLSIAVTHNTKLLILNKHDRVTSIPTMLSNII